MGETVTPDEDATLSRYLERQAFAAVASLLGLLIVCVWRF